MKSITTVAFAFLVNITPISLLNEAAIAQPTEAKSGPHTIMIKGGDGLPIAMTVGGNPDGPALLFIHSYMGSSTIWQKQFASDLAKSHRLVSIDMRGHGSSAKPIGPEHYTDTRLSAADIAAVIEAAEVTKPILVAWAYGGYFAMDYIRHYGDKDIGGIVVIEGVAGLEPPPNSYYEYRKRKEEAYSLDIGIISAWTRNFADYLMRSGPLPEQEAETIRTMAMMTPHWVRRALDQRPLDNADLAAIISVPVMFVVTSDENWVVDIVRRVMARLRQAEMVVIPTGGSLSFWYETNRFNQALARFSKAFEKPLRGAGTGIGHPSAKHTQ